MKQDHGHVGRFQPFFELAQSLKGTAAAVTEQQPLLFGQFTCGMSAGLVGDLLKQINEVKIHIRGQDVLANPFSDVRVNFTFVENSSFVVFLEY